MKASRKGLNFDIIRSMGEKRKIPYGVMNWAELVRECFVVDNTRYIRELETIKAPVFLRPKRFGKTVVCSMLAHYYDNDSGVMPPCQINDGFEIAS